MKRIIYKENFLEFYNQGLNDTEIGVKLNCAGSGVTRFRRELGYPANFIYKSKIPHDKYVELRNSGLSNLAVSKILNISSKALHDYGKKHKIADFDSSCKDILTKLQMEVLVGTLLGDASLIIGKENKYPNGAMTHCIPQKDYIFYKYEFIKNLCSREPYYYKTKTPDKRNGNLYETYGIYIRVNKNLTWLHNELYSTGKKIVTKNLLKYFTPLSMALMYMDDGNVCSSGGYSIATMCFDDDSLLNLQEKFLSFGIPTSIHKERSMYILKEGRKIFEDLIRPYIIESMKYKLHQIK